MSESSSEESEQLPSTSPPDILEVNNGSIAPNWRTWVSAWNNYRLATKLDKEEEVRQVATLLAETGKEANKGFRTFTWASQDDAKTIAVVVSKFEEYCIPRENTIYERFLFFTRDQRESETVDQYEGALPNCSKLRFLSQSHPISFSRND